ncbi:MAG: hypothetical protein ACI8SA_002420 [Dokdonia sp.]|jgi:hypothetical protein
MKITYALILLIITFFTSCQNKNNCAGIIENTYYTENNIRTKTITDCKDSLRVYEHYQRDCMNCAFKIYYTPEGTPDSLEGLAWIHTFYNMYEYKIGDTLDITIEVAAPPYVESEFTITDNDGNIAFTKLDSFSVRWSDQVDSSTFLSGTFYNYKTVIDDSTEYFEMTNIYSFNGKKLWTVNRKQLFMDLTIQNNVGK